ncbi:MAG: hypothetical protein IJO45_00870 [Oscillospiraceae bacterium]|nr:hypothetical protein [Oscillospiraceae bacterium]
MRILLYIVILAAMLFAPVDRLDIAKLEPVEAVAIYLEDGQVVLQTDGESIGIGNTAQEALTDLKENALAVIYLDTADYLLIGEGAENAAQDLHQYLRESVQIGKYNGGKVKEEAEYLDVHGDAAKPEN